MGYFTFLASLAFKTDSEGRRLFCPYGVLARPYIVDDPVVEARLLRKMFVFMTVSLIVALAIGIAIGVPMATSIVESHGQLPSFFPLLAVLVGAAVLQVPAVNLVFGSDLRGLPRAASKVSLRMAYSDFGRRLPVPLLVLGIVGSLLIVPIGLLALVFLPGRMTFPVVTLLAVGCLSAAAYGYALWLKLTQT